MKKKPIGGGDYTVCRECRGTGIRLDIKRSKNSKNPKEKQAFSKTKCKYCQGFGWVDAPH